MILSKPLMLDKVSTYPAFKWLIVWMDFNISLLDWMCPFSVKWLQMWSHNFFFEVLLIGLWSVSFIYSVLIKPNEALEWLDWHLGLLIGKLAGQHKSSSMTISKEFITTVLLISFQAASAATSWVGSTPERWTFFLWLNSGKRPLLDWPWVP